MGSEGCCQICLEAKFRYCCPKCNICYCSVECYKSPLHLKCSEEFYKDCIQEELTSRSESGEDVKKIYEILQRMRESDAGIPFEGDSDILDSDDEIGENENECGSDEESLAIRLCNVNINDTTEVWQKLTESEKQEFKRMVETGDIINLLPKCEPWWLKANSRIVDLSDKKDCDKSNGKPKLAKNVPKFADIFKTTPSPYVHYNLWNILASYTCTVRFFSAEHQNTPWEASYHLVNLSATLKYNTNFEDVDDALLSVQIEGISTISDIQQIQTDTKHLMLSQQNKLLALSDILELFKFAKKCTRNKIEDNDFQKLFSACSGNIDLSRKRLQMLIKKIEFMLSYFMQEIED